MTTRKNTQDPGLAAVLLHFGSRAAVARALGISRPAVAQWDRIPPARAATLARLTGIPVDRLVSEVVSDQSVAAA